MTHEELLAEINKQEYSDYKSWGSIPEWPYKTIRAVVELHKPEPFGLVPSGFICGGCDNRCGCYEGDILSYNDWFTCPTIKAIEKELA